MRRAGLFALCGLGYAISTKPKTPNSAVTEPEIQTPPKASLPQGLCVEVLILQVKLEFLRVRPAQAKELFAFLPGTII